MCDSELNVSGNGNVDEGSEVSPGADSEVSEGITADDEHLEQGDDAEDENMDKDPGGSISNGTPKAGVNGDGNMMNSLQQDVTVRSVAYYPIAMDVEPGKYHGNGEGGDHERMTLRPKHISQRRKR